MRTKQKQCYRCLAAVFLALFSLGVFAVSARAEAEPSQETSALPEEPARVYVTVADATGTLALAHAEVPLLDADADGVLTVYDALQNAHDAYFDGGADAGFSPEQTDAGLLVKRLWGEEAGRYSLYLNHMAEDDLLAPIRDGDLLCAVVRADLAGDGGLYCYFDAPRASVSGSQELTLTLSAAGYDEEGLPAVLPVPDAVICIDGRDTAFMTDEAGRVTLRFDGSGCCVVSARKDGVPLILPVCSVTVSGEEPFAGDRGALICWIALSVAALAGLVAALRRQVRRMDVL